MNIIATVLVDLDCSPLGTRSRLADDLCGWPVLRRTLERALAVEGLSSVHVPCRVEQAAAVRSLLHGLEIHVETHNADPPAYYQLVRAGRLWGLDGWRGGASGLCCFDEDFHVPLLHALLQRIGADAILSIPAAAAVLDPALLSAMVRHYRDNIETSRITIVQAPPGLAALVIDRRIVAELAPTGMPPGALLVYQPGNPLPDPTGKEGCFRPAAAVVEARGRLLCDTRRGFERVRRLIEAGGESWDAPRICRWLIEDDGRHGCDVPEEIEIELTTDHPLKAPSLVRPRGAEVGSRGPMAIETVREIVDWFRGHDDVRIVLAGFGDPCLHPHFGEICRILRGSAAAIAVRTSGLVDDPDIDAALFETPVDLLEVALDAASAETYRAVNGVDAFDRVIAKLESWIARRQVEHRVLPMIVPSMVKADETLDDMEAFVDDWQRRLGAVLVSGYSRHAGQRPCREVTSMAPPKRGPCRRVFSRAMILADGRMTTCDQDFAGRQVVGRIGECTPADLWQGRTLADIRANRIDRLPLCPNCDEWHRP